MEKVRLNKFISHNTNFSRREADELLVNGKVSVNGRVAKLGDEVSQNAGEKDGEKVRVNGRLIHQKKQFSAILYHKPKGELVSKRDDRGRRTIFESLPSKFKGFVSVGRLDFASEGLLILTDAPAIANALEKSDIEREYYVKVKGSVKPEVFEAMREGFEASDATKGGHAKSKITSMKFAPFLAFGVVSASGGYTRLKVILSEGQNREIRRFFGCFDLEVVELKRTAFGRMNLGTLGEGKWRFFTASEYEDLRDFLQVSKVRW